MSTSLKMSQGYEVLKPKSDKAFPIPCNEWDVLKEQLKDLTTEPWFFHTTASLLLGAALATLIAIWTGAISSTTVANANVVAWAVVAVCAITGFATLYFAHKERGVHRAKAQTVLTHMRLIEERFEREEI
jgi:hypothetical protein